MRSKKSSALSILAAFLVISGTTAVFATGKALPPAQAEKPGYVERMLFATQGEKVVKVTYDGETWEAYPIQAQKEEWRWYSYQEYTERIRQISDPVKITYNPNEVKSPGEMKGFQGLESCLVVASMVGAEKEHAKHAQTLKDIENGIKVSKPKTIFLKDNEGPKGFSKGWVQWYCFGYTFKDRAGNEVDLGVFETRGELFAALKRYYDKEVTSGALTENEADSLYNNIAHEVRNVDEVALTEKLLNQPYAPYNLF